MPPYPMIHFNNFMHLVKSANPHFERLVTSSLRPIIDLLGDRHGHAQEAVMRALVGLERRKQVKYWEALLYLLLTYDIPQTRSVFNELSTVMGDRQAAVYARQPVLPDVYGRDFGGENVEKLYEKVGDSLQRKYVIDPVITAPSQLTGMSIAHHLLLTRRKIGVMLIHLHLEVPELQYPCEGSSHLHHISHIINIAAYAGIDVCVLLQRYRDRDGRLADDVGAPLRSPLARCHNVTRVWATEHAGGKEHGFRDFVESHEEIVVVGFDANVCVRANCFGALEVYAPPDDETRLLLAPPIIASSDIVTSRAALVSGKRLEDVWGVLAGR